MAYNVLIVDDSLIVRRVVARTLKIAGVDVGMIFEAGNGREALAHLEKEWIDMVFLDLNMPEMNGFELVDKMEAGGLLESTPVIVITTERSTTKIDALRKKGIRACISKPFTPEKIRNVVNEIIGGSHED